MRSIKLIIVESDDLSRGGTQALIKEAEGVNLLGAYPDLTAAEAALEKGATEILLLSDSLPRSLDVGKIVQRLNHTYPDLLIIVISDKLNCTYTRRIFEKGARAFVHRDDHLDEKLVSIVRSVRRGEVYVSPSVSALLVRENTNIPGVDQRDADILRFVVDGYTAGEVALLIGISAQSVYRRLGQLRDLFQVRTNEQLIATTRQIDLPGSGDEKGSHPTEKD